jgi:hypothetical protein
MFLPVTVTSTLTVPPRILYNDEMILFGKNGRESYVVEKVFFHKCKSILQKDTEDCIHDIQIELYNPYVIKKDILKMNLCDIVYDDLVWKNYIKYLKNWNRILIMPSESSNDLRKCKLIHIPDVK